MSIHQKIKTVISNFFPQSPKCVSVRRRHVRQSHPQLNSIKESTKTYGLEGNDMIRIVRAWMWLLGLTLRWAGNRKALLVEMLFPGGWGGHKQLPRQHCFCENTQEIQHFQHLPIKQSRQRLSFIKHNAEEQLYPSHPPTIDLSCHKRQTICLLGRDVPQECVRRYPAACGDTGERLCTPVDPVW